MVNIGVNGKKLSQQLWDDCYRNPLTGKSYGTTGIIMDYMVNDLANDHTSFTYMKAMYLNRWRRLRYGGATVTQTAAMPIGLAQVVTTGGGCNATFAASTITRAAGSWIADGHILGGILVITGLTAGLSANNTCVIITGITATVLTCAKIVGAGTPFAAGGPTTAGTYLSGDEGTRLGLNLWFTSQVGSTLDCFSNVVRDSHLAVSDASGLQLYFDSSGHLTGTVPTPGPNNGYGLWATLVFQDRHAAGLA